MASNGTRRKTGVSGACRRRGILAYSTGSGDGKDGKEGLIAGLPALAWQKSLLREGSNEVPSLRAREAFVCKGSGSNEGARVLGTLGRLVAAVGTSGAGLALDRTQLIRIGAGQAPQAARGGVPVGCGEGQQQHEKGSGRDALRTGACSSFSSKSILKQEQQPCRVNASGAQFKRAPVGIVAKRARAARLHLHVGKRACRCRTCGWAETVLKLGLRWLLIS